MEAGTQTVNNAGNDLQLVSFNVGEEEFGLDILRIQEIIRTQRLTRVPTLPDYVDGIINLRGRVIPVVALRRRLGLDAAEENNKTRIVIVDVGGQVLGFVVDGVSKVLRLDPEKVEPTPSLGGATRNYIRGVGRLDSTLLLLLDVERLMDDEELQALSSVH